MMQLTRYHLDADGQLASELAEYQPDDTLAEQAGAASYTKDIRGIARAVWQGLDIDAYSIMWDTVGLGIEKAWYQGAKSCGISEDELTLEEKLRRDTMITDQRNYIMGFLDWVHEHRRDGPEKLPFARIVSRANMWGHGWHSAYNEAMSRACANQKLRWVLGPTKVHCNDCATYADRIYRASIWQKYDIRPQHPSLGCHGFGACAFEVTDEKCNPGRPPRMTGT
jgi:hypothetical protein